MITIKHPIDFPDTYPLDRIGPLKDILFFDIETTGFSGETSQDVYKRQALPPSHTR